MSIKNKPIILAQLQQNCILGLTKLKILRDFDKVQESGALFKCAYLAYVIAEQRAADTADCKITRDFYVRTKKDVDNANISDT